MTEALPPPPIPAEVDLTDFAFMPLEVARLRRSKAWLYCKRRPELAFYMLNLWTAAWHERPAGSLDPDEEVLADLAMATPARWKKVRVAVLRGWVKHSNNRIYHPVVTEKVVEAWGSKLAQREKTLRGRMVSLEKRIRDCKDENSKSLMTQQLDALSQELSQALSRKQSQTLSLRPREEKGIEGKGRELREEKNQEPEPPAAANGNGAHLVPASDPKKQLYDLGRTLLGKNAGGLISKAIGQTDESTVGSILGDMATRTLADAKAYFNAAVQHHVRRRDVVV